MKNAKRFGQFYLSHWEFPTQHGKVQEALENLGIPKLPIAGI
ncbi:MAG: hypothetical protein ABIT70_11595 [Sulfuriferula sp.]